MNRQPKSLGLFANQSPFGVSEKSLQRKVTLNRFRLLAKNRMSVLVSISGWQMVELTVEFSS